MIAATMRTARAIQMSGNSPVSTGGTGAVVAALVGVVAVSVGPVVTGVSVAVPMKRA